MKKNKALNFVKFALISFLALSFLGIMPVQAKDWIGLPTIEDPIIFEPQIGIPGFDDEITMKESSTLYIAQMIEAFYKYGLAVGGILAAVVLMAGGLLWLTSGGSSDKVTQAKSLIIGSVSGIGLLFGAWIILNTINPNLLDFKISAINGIPAIFIEDGKDGMIDSIGSLPKDAHIKYICLPELKLCGDTIPPSTQLDLSICINKLGEDFNCYNSQSGPQKACCATSNEITEEMDKQCLDKANRTSCKVTPTSIENDGYCYDNVCISRNQKVCCQCGQGCSNGWCVYATCKNDISAYECREWCANDWIGFSTYYYPGGSDSYSCDGGTYGYCEAISGTW